MALRFSPTIPSTRRTARTVPAAPRAIVRQPAGDRQPARQQDHQQLPARKPFATFTLARGLDFRSSASYTSAEGVQQRYTSRLLRAALGSGQANVDNNLRTTSLLENTLTLRRSRVAATSRSSADLRRRSRSATRATRRAIGFTSDLLGYRRLNLAETITADRARSATACSRTSAVSTTVRRQVSADHDLPRRRRVEVRRKQQVGLLPVVGAGVARERRRLHERVPAVSELKLRGSWGRTGSEAISSYQSLAAWSVGSPYVIGTTRLNNGANPSRNSNPNLKWETSEQTDLGFDLGMLDNRVSFTLDAYKKTTKDLLYSKQVPYYTGFSDYVTNIGSVENKGMELGLDTRHNVRAFDIRLGGNLSFNPQQGAGSRGDKEFFLDGVNGSLPTFRTGGDRTLGRAARGISTATSGMEFFKNAAEVAASVRLARRLEA